MIRKSLSIAALALSSAGIAYAQEPQLFTGAGQKSDIDCDGAALTVEGASNTLDISGDCTVFRLEGAANRIHVSLAPNARLIVVGAENQVVWSARDGKKPQVSVTGAGNRVSMAR